MRFRMLSLVVASLALQLQPSAQAQSAAYPTKPIRLFVGAPAGGPTDVIARSLIQQMGDSLGQPVIVENRGGAAGTLAAGIVAKSPADGYTLIVTPSAHAYAASMYDKLPFDPVKDFRPVGQIGMMPLVAIANKAFPAGSLRDLVERAKAQPTAVNYGSSGTGSAHHLAGELFKLRTGIQMTHVPYKGSAGVVNAMLAGDIDLTFDSISTSMPHIRGGRMHALAVTSQQRSALAPEVATVQEQGIAGFDVTGWYALIAPAGTPPEITQRLSREIAAALRQPPLQAQLAAGGYEPVGSTPEALQAHIEREITRWAAVVKSTGAKVD